MDNLTDFIRVKAPGPFERELERLKRIEAAAKWFVDRWESPCAEWPENVSNAVDQIRKAVRR